MGKAAVLPPAAAGLLTARQVCELLNLTRRCLERWAHMGKFPKPVHLSARAVRWKRADVDANLRGLVS